MIGDVEKRVLHLLRDRIRIGNCLLVNKAWSQTLLNSHVLAQYRKARQRAADQVELGLSVDEEDERSVWVELIVQYRTERVYGTLLGMSVVMWDDVIDIISLIHEGLAEDIEQVRQLALKEDYTVSATLQMRKTRLPLGFKYALPEQLRHVQEQPWCFANFVYQRFGKAHNRGLV